MDYSKKLQYHYRPQKGWINDPNGLVYFKGYYHVFYQHSPNFEIPWKEPMHWGHSRTKDFLNWEELPVALYPDKPYDNNGCWSGTAIVKDDILYLFYASVQGEEKKQTVSIAFSKDGVHFKKYSKNPVIDHYPSDGGPDFRDPSVFFINNKYYCVMATGNPETKTARLLLYQSENLFDWNYNGIMREWDNCVYAECPSVVPTHNKCLLSTSVCPIEANHYFSISFGNIKNGKFYTEHSATLDYGPDQYAGQIFQDHLGRNILITWIPGWKYSGFVSSDIGCMSIPREITLNNGKICGYPIKEFHHLLKDEDPFVKRTKNGFVIERTGRSPVVYEGIIDDIKILRDEYLLEIFINGGQSIYTVLL